MRMTYSYKLTASVLLIGWLTVSSAPVIAKGLVRHPLDPLNISEYLTILTTLSGARRVDSSSRYALITLQEPPKAEVMQWKPGDSATRRAFVIVKKGSQTFEAIVDLGQGKIISWQHVKGVQPGILLTDEWNAAQRIVKADPDWQSMLRRRGIKNIRDIVCVPHTIGNFGAAQEAQNRLVNVTCFDSHGTSNYWAHPIEGVIATVDLNKHAIVGLTDTGMVPIPKAFAKFDQKSVGNLRIPVHGISITQPKGPSFKIEGRVVTWQKWQFHFRIDPRLGPVVSLVRYNDNGALRSILYQGSLSELFVPYMDPGAGWYFKTYMDAGEYGIGKLAALLEPGKDCPGNAVFFNVVFADDEGHPYAQPRAACLYERYAGDVAWRHFERESGQSEVRRRTDLVLRFVTAVGNYDYLFDWIFRQDGTIKIAVGATGVEQVKGVRSRTIADDVKRQDTAYGHLVAEHTVAVNHDHFFNFRLDLDIDGPRNSFLLERLQTLPVEEQSPRKSIWVVEPETIATEQDAKLRIDLERPALWRVINPEVTGPLGYPVSYQLQPKTNAVSLLSRDDSPQRRAGFTDYHLWVTPYQPGERYAAGIYPNQSKGGAGLPQWTRADRSVRNTDLVLWYTLGFHHVVRAEDWPILSTTWHDFELRPFDFFARNPALDLQN